MPSAANWYHAHQNVISRGQGRTAVGIAAYVTGEAMKDEETGKWLKRNHPGEVLAFGTTAPNGAADYLTDNSQIARAWNDAQKADTRKNAQLARHWNIALSREFTLEQQAEVMKAIAQDITERYGVLATWSIHKPTDHGDDRNVHGHIVHNMKDVGPSGFGEKVRDLVAFKTAKQEMEWARETIATRINEGLERAGLDERVTHLSYEARGIDREAKRHLGDKQNQAELKGEATPVGDHNRAVDERNKSRDAEHDARQAEQAQLTAEIIDLQQERQRRQRGMEPIQATDGDIDKLAHRQPDAYAQAEQAHKEQEKAEHNTHRLIEDGQRTAEEAQRTKDQREKEDKARAEAGEPTDAKSRYFQAVGANFSIRDPFVTLANAAMTEYAMFREGQRELKELASKASDPDQKRMIELRAEIEKHEYGALVHDRLAGIGRSIIRGENHDTRQDSIDASRHRARALELRGDREGAAAETAKATGMEAADKLAEESKEIGTSHGWSPLVARGPGAAGHNMTKAERIEVAKRVADAALHGDEPKKAEKDNIARQAEATKQRDGLRPDQPTETAKPTPEGRKMDAKEQARTEAQAAMRGTMKDERTEGRPAGRTTGKGAPGR